MLKRFIAVIAAVSMILCCLPVSSSAVNFKGSDKINIVLDPGHGGKDSGACHNGILEKNLNIRLASLIRDKLLANGSFNVFMTRTGDTFSEIVDRGLYANSVNADLLISIHCDSCDVPSKSGVTAYTSVIGDCALVSLGKSIASKVASSVGMYSNGVIQKEDDAGYYWNTERRWDIKDSSLKVLSDYYGIPTWCAKFKIQSMIVEHGFMSNGHDIGILNSDANLQKMAAAEASAIITYYTGHTHKYGASTVDFQSNCVFQGKKSERCTVCSHRRNIELLHANPNAHYWQCIDKSANKWTCRITENLNSKGHKITNHTRVIYKGKAGANLNWSYDTASKQLSFTGSGAMYNYSSSKSAPWKKYASQCTSVSLCSGVTSIGSYAFHGFSKLSGISIPDKCRSIGKYAFLNCTALTNARLTGISALRGDEFTGCKSLKDIYIYRTNCNINKSATKLGTPGFTRIRGYENSTAQTFAYSKGYMFVNLKTGDTSGKAGDNAVWKYDTHKKSLTFSGSGALYNYPATKQSIWSVYKTYATSAAISGNITSVGVYTFNGFAKLKTISISDKCTKIGKYAFINCTALTKAELPSVTLVDVNAFTGCKALKDIYINKPNCSINKSATTLGVPGYTRIRGYEGSKAQSFAYSNGYMFVNLETGNTSGKAGDNVIWAYDTHQKTLTFSGSGAIYNYPITKQSPWSIYKTYATSATIADGVTSVGVYTFNGFAKLKSVSISDSCTKIGKYAFMNCTLLSEAQLSASVTSVASAAFSGCTKLENIYIYNPDCTIDRSGDKTLGTPGFTVIHSNTLSTAEDYAASFGYTFNAIDLIPTE